LGTGTLSGLPYLTPVSFSFEGRGSRFAEAVIATRGSGETGTLGAAGMLNWDKRATTTAPEDMAKPPKKIEHRRQDHSRMRIDDKAGGILNPAVPASGPGTHSCFFIPLTLCK
jgi:hypothetical protein